MVRKIQLSEEEHSREKPRSGRTSVCVSNAKAIVAGCLSKEEVWSDHGFGVYSAV